MRFTRLSGALVALALPFVMSGVADADPDTSLTLTIAVLDGDTNSVELSCEPAGGSHPSADIACDELLAARGDFGDLPGDQQTTACTMEYRPVLAIAEGTWRGDQVSWEREFGNPCALHTATGTVFRF
jgi:hypothetical protein